MTAMILVNFLGGYTNVSSFLKHWGNYTNYPDTIMPHFFFAVGFAFRISFLRAAKNPDSGRRDAYIKIFWPRAFGLLYLGLLLYGTGNETQTWDQFKAIGFNQGLLNFAESSFWMTLVHIAFAMIICAPVISKPAWVRFLYACVSVTMYPVIQLLVYTRTGVVFGSGGEGGIPAAFAWTFILLMGTITHDIVMHATAEEYNNINVEDDTASIHLESYEDKSLLLADKGKIRKPACSGIHLPTKPRTKLALLVFFGSGVYGSWLFCVLLRILCAIWDMC